MEDALKIQEPQQIVLVQAMLAGVQLEQRQSRENGRFKIRLRGLRDGFGAVLRLGRRDRRGGVGFGISSGIVTS